MHPASIAVLGLALALLGATGPAHATDAGDVCPPPPVNDPNQPCVVSTNVVATTGSMLDFGTRPLVISQGRRIEIAGPGTLTIIAGALTVQPGGQLRGSSTSRAGASISVQVEGDILFQRSGATRSQADLSSPVSGGALELTAGGDVVIDGDLITRGSSVDADGGAVTVTAGGDIRIGGDIRAPGGLGAFGGLVTLETTTGQILVNTPTPPQIIDASGGINGGDITMTAGPRIDTSARLELNANGASGDGGFLTLTADGDIVLRGIVVGSASGTVLEGGGFGADLSITAGGSFHILNRIDISGAVPDGEGGVLDAGAGVDVVQNGQVLAQGPGTESFGGNVFFAAGRLLHLNALIDLHGGGLGGAGLLTAQADDEVRASAEVNADGDAGFVQLTTIGTGGLPGRLVRIDPSAFLHARSAPAGLGGVIIAQGCGVSVATGARLIAQGPQSENLVQVSGPGNESTIAGTLTSTVSNKVQYRTTAPSLAGGTFTPAAMPTQVASLPMCRPPGVCGNGVLEPGEACDDDNEVECDGCSPTCQAESCGNGIDECEDCDDGNPTDGDGCDSNCTVTGCGNEIVTAGEQCDDGNTVADDGCSPTCQIEIPPGCGDGTPDPGEGCDDGNNRECDGCSPTCRVEECGNGVRECAEAQPGGCEDFNTIACDGCSATCRVEECGNGVVECGEQCDLGAVNGTPGADCDRRCRVPTICTPGAEVDCVPCATHLDCGPTGLCGGAVCEGGECLTELPLVCGTCTTCDALAGCVAGAEGTSCADADVCNGSETCRNGVCSPGPALDCRDTDQCTDETCDPAGGCQRPSRTGYDGITCQLDNLVTNLNAASVTDASAKIRPKLTNAVGKIRTKLGQARGQANAKKAVKLVKAAEKQLKKLAKLIKGGPKKKQLSQGLADQLGGFTARAGTAAAAVRAGLAT